MPLNTRALASLCALVLVATCAALAPIAHASEPPTPPAPAPAAKPSTDSPALAPPTPAADAPAPEKAASTGTFTPPEVKADQRAPFGPKSGTPTPCEPVPPTRVDPGLSTTIFSGAAALALLITLLSAFLLSRTTKPDGSPTRALTLGARLAAGFGVCIIGILSIGVISSRSSTVVSNADAQVDHHTGQCALIAQLNADMYAIRLRAKAFLLSNSDADLAAYSDASASFAHKLDLTRQTIVVPDRVKMVEAIAAGIDDYERTFAEVVRAIDERNGLVERQMFVSAGRATELLAALASSARAEGDLRFACAAATTNEHYQNARINFFKYLRKGDPALAQAAVKSAGDVGKEIQALTREPGAPARKAAMTEAAEAVAFWASSMERAEQLQQRRNDLVNSGLDKIGPDIARTTDLLRDSLQKTKDQIAAAAQATEHAAKLQIAAVSAVVALIGALVAFAIARGVIRGLKTLENRLKDIADGEGDLTKRVEIHSRDEIGLVAQWFNKFVGKIETVVAEVKSGSSQIDAGGTQIAAASQSMAQGASEQASSLQQISASIEQMSGQTQQSAENARQANTLAEESKKSADRGQLEMADMTRAVTEIKESSAEISKIIKVIDEIAFQTNLLALNAAVEAARAGEAGKGFAVVAEEVRNLAQRSAEAAKNTSAMIETSVKRAENGVQIASRVGQSLEEIATATTKVNALLSEIASAASEQATGIGQVNQGVSQLDQVTQQNAGNSEELASSAEELSSQVASLNQLVSQFKVSDASPSPTTRPASKPAKHKPAPAKPHKKPATVSPEQAIPMAAHEPAASF